MELYSEAHFLSSKTATAKFETFRQNDKFCDVSLYSEDEDKVVKAHRNVLAASCPYFEVMFTTGLKETYEELVKLPAISSDVLPLLVEFIYTGHTTVDQLKVHQLMAAAHMLELEDLVAACTRCLKVQLNPSNALMTLRLADTYNCSELVDHALTCIAKHWTTVMQEEEFLDLPLALFSKMISSVKPLKNKLDVVHAFVRWLEHEPATRAPHCVKLMHLLPLYTLPKRKLDKIWGKMKDEQLANLLRISSSEIAALADTRPGNTIYLIDSTRMYKYDLRNTVWETLEPMPSARKDFCAAALGGRIYAVGGRINNIVVSSGEVYDPATNVWSQIAYMNNSVCNFGLVALDGKLYAFGTEVVEMYDPEDNVWTEIEPMFYQIRDMAVVTYKGNNSCVTNKVLRYQPKTDGSSGEWRFCADMSCLRYNHAAVVLGDHLYVLGGRSNNAIYNTVARYDFTMDQWEDVAPMANARHGFAAHASNADGLLLVASGSGITNWKNMEMYIASENRWTQGPYIPCLDVDQWEDVAPMANARHGFAAHASNADGLLLVASGSGITNWKNMEMYIASENRWTQGPYIPCLDVVSSAML